MNEQSLLNELNKHVDSAEHHLKQLAYVAWVIRVLTVDELMDELKDPEADEASRRLVEIDNIIKKYGLQRFMDSRAFRAQVEVWVRIYRGMLDPRKVPND